mmetsp:Transcript_31391/g.48057  ORF Transcript_31391/g.48057 Transcript_31391/m.48057 type:complete len:155 (+) Transcript_31391:1177-1641(+)
MRGENRFVDNARNILETVIKPYNADFFSVVRGIDLTELEILNPVASDNNTYDILEIMRREGFNETKWADIKDQNALGGLQGRPGSGIFQYFTYKQCYDIIEKYENDERGGKEYRHIVIIRSDHICTGVPFCLDDDFFQHAKLIEVGFQDRACAN